MVVPGRIRGLDFDRTEEMLFVTFVGGRRFRFTSIDEELFTALGDIDTRDRVFRRRIADEFRWDELPMEA